MHSQTDKQIRDKRGRFLKSPNVVMQQVKETINDIVRKDTEKTSPDVIEFKGYNEPKKVERKPDEQKTKQTKLKPFNTTDNNKGKDKRQIALESITHDIISKVWPIVKTRNFIIGFSASTLLAWIF